MASQAEKIGERERLSDEEIIKKYGEGTLIFKTFNIKAMLTSFRFLYGLIVFGIVITIVGMFALRIFVHEQFQWKMTAVFLLYIPILLLSKIVKTIFTTKKDIITKKNVIMQRAFKEDRIVI